LGLRRVLTPSSLGENESFFEVQVHARENILFSFERGMRETPTLSWLRGHTKYGEQEVKKRNVRKMPYALRESSIGHSLPRQWGRRKLRELYSSYFSLPNSREKERYGVYIGALGMSDTF